MQMSHQMEMNALIVLEAYSTFLRFRAFSKGTKGEDNVLLGGTVQVINSAQFSSVSPAEIYMRQPVTETEQ